MSQSRKDGMRLMSGDGMVRHSESDDDVDPASPHQDGTPPAHAGAHMLRPMSPAEANDIAARREERAARHLVAAEHLRETAQRTMEQFDSVSERARMILDEWSALRDLPQRSPGDDARFAVLTCDLLDSERRLGRQWDMLARMLREATHHEAAAQVLLTGHFHE